MVKIGELYVCVLLCLNMCGNTSEYYSKYETYNWSGWSCWCEHVLYMWLYEYFCHAFMVCLVEIGHCSGGVYVTSGVDKSLPRRGVCDLSGSIEWTMVIGTTCIVSSRSHCINILLMIAERCIFVDDWWTMNLVAWLKCALWWVVIHVCE